MDYSAFVRKKLFEEAYNALSEEDKRLYALLSAQEKGNGDVMQALDGQREQLSDILQKQSWWRDLSSNVAGNAIWDGSVWLLSRLVRNL